MTETAQPIAMPAIQPTVAVPAADVISPAEAKFWQEQAERAPALLRHFIQEDTGKLKSSMQIYKISGIALGAALGIASFTKYIPGKWKIASGLGAAASLLAGTMAGSTQKASDDIQHMFISFADMLEKNPQARSSVASRLQQAVTADDIQQFGLDKAIALRMSDLAMEVATVRSHADRVLCSAPQTAPQLAF